MLSVGFLIAASAVVMSKSGGPEGELTVMGIPAFAFLCYLIAFGIAFVALRDIWGRNRRRRR